jgi:hypothetical protein
MAGSQQGFAREARLDGLAAISPTGLWLAKGIDRV